MKKNGWIKLHRNSLDSSVFQNPEIWAFWSWCLMRASHGSKDVMMNGSDVFIDKGQFITGRNTACSELKWLTARKYRTFTNYLKSTNRLTIKSTSKYSIFTIEKWEEYQIEEVKATIKKTSKATKSRPSGDQVATTNKNGKNGKNGKKTTQTASPSKAGGLKVLEIDDSVDSKEIASVMNIFKTTINPTLNFGHKTQRKAVSEMIEQFGVEQVMQMSQAAAVIAKQGNKYAPVITTPYQLRDKWGQLQLYIEKNHSNKPNTKIETL